MRAISTVVLLPWLIFSGAFLGTTAIGAAVIGLSRGEEWGFVPGRANRVGMDMSAIDPAIFRQPGYWIMLAVCVFGPLLCAGGLLLVLWSLKRRQAGAAVAPAAMGIAIPRMLYLLAWLLVVVALYAAGLRLGMVVQAWRGTLEEHYYIRAFVLGNVRGEVFGVLYSAMLVLLVFPLRRALLSGSWRHWAEFLVWLASYWVLALLVVQKLLVSLSLMVIGISVVASGRLNRNLGKMAAVAGTFFAVIYAAMATQMEQWSLLENVDHIISRTGDTYPYILSLGPMRPFTWENYLGGSVFGWPDHLGHVASYNVDLFNVMYPKVDGAVAISAPMWSYLDVGWPGFFLTMAIVAAAAGGAALIGLRAHRSPTAFALYVLILIQLYHVTQIPLFGTLRWGYGWVYGAAAIAAVIVIESAIRASRRGAAARGAPGEQKRGMAP